MDEADNEIDDINDVKETTDGLQIEIFFLWALQSREACKNVFKQTHSQKACQIRR